MNHSLSLIVIPLITSGSGSRQINNHTFWVWSLCYDTLSIIFSRKMEPFFVPHFLKVHSIFLLYFRVSLTFLKILLVCTLNEYIDGVLVQVHVHCLLSDSTVEDIHLIL